MYLVTFPCERRTQQRSRTGPNLNYAATKKMSYKRVACSWLEKSLKENHRLLDHETLQRREGLENRVLWGSRLMNPLRVSDHVNLAWCEKLLRYAVSRHDICSRFISDFHSTVEVETRKKERYRLCTFRKLCPRKTQQGLSPLQKTRISAFSVLNSPWE